MSGSFDKVERLMEQATGPVYSGATLRVAVSGEEIYRKPCGQIDASDSSARVTLKTRFDVASLTKPMTVGTLAMLGLTEGGQVSTNAVGHLGFTGCSVWIDRERDATVALLTNRVHPSRENISIRRFRPALHDAIWTALDSDL